MRDTRLYVVDTSYLLELYRVAGCFEETAHVQIHTKFSQALESDARFYVPVAVLYELANHIADVKNAGERQTLAERLSDAVHTSLETSSPWTITQLTDADDITALMQALKQYASKFAQEYSKEKLGLTDTAVILEAERLGQRYQSGSLHNYHIHIWTRHQAVKAREPHPEPNQFV